MAEDQGVNGTIWNKEANYILSWFGWETIGDIDMDVLGIIGISKIPLPNNRLSRCSLEISTKI